jgi:hypothetical protein
VPLSEEDIENDLLVQTIVGMLANPVVTLEAVASATATDASLSAVRNFIINGWPTDKQRLSEDLQCYVKLKHELSVCLDGQCAVRGCRTVIPEDLRTDIEDLAHEGHPQLS